MSYEHIEYDEREDDLRAVISLDRPEKKNALSTPLLRELDEALGRVEDNDNIRGVILRGNGGTFSAGYDMNESSGGDGPPSVDDLLDRMEVITSHLYTIWNLNKPVVAAVDGYCLAGGSDLALMCDIVIGAEDVKFGYPGQRMAGHPPTLTYPFFMSIHHAKELLYTGKIVDGDRVESMGIFNRIVPNDELMAEAHGEIDAIAKVPGGGVRIQKHSLNSVLEQQGFRGTLKNSEFLDPLAHLTDVSKEYYDLESMEEKLEWMNETDKAMRDTVDE